MARQRIRCEQDDVDEEHKRADTHSKFSVPPERVVSVFPQEREKYDGEIQRVAMKVLQNEWKLRFATIRAFWLANGACRRIGEKRAVVRLAIVVAGGAKTQRPP